MKNFVENNSMSEILLEREDSCSNAGGTPAVRAGKMPALRAGARPAVAAILAALLLISGCTGPLLGVNVFVVGEKTALEKQVLGVYRSLNADFESFGSVRGVDELGRLRQPPAITESKQAAILALQNRAYNRDDVEDFLRRGLAGENNQGTLALFEEALARDPAPSQDFIRSVIAEENRDRETILNRLMATTPGVGEGDAARIQAIFSSVNRDTAPAGARVQLEDGTWTRK